MGCNKANNSNINI